MYIFSVHCILDVLTRIHFGSLCATSTSGSRLFSFDLHTSFTIWILHFPPVLSMITRPCFPFNFLKFTNSQTHLTCDINIPEFSPDIFCLKITCYHLFCGATCNKLVIAENFILFPPNFLPDFPIFFPVLLTPLFLYIFTPVTSWGSSIKIYVTNWLSVSTDIYIHNCTLHGHISQIACNYGLHFVFGRKLCFLVSSMKIMNLLIEGKGKFKVKSEAHTLR